MGKKCEIKITVRNYLQIAMAAPLEGNHAAGAVQMVQQAIADPNCPPGLEYLVQLDQLLVNQQVDLGEVMTGIEMKNRYEITNSAGQRCYFANEESECCERMCCGPNRGFIFHITDNSGKEVMRITRIFELCGGCVCLDKGFE